MNTSNRSANHIKTRRLICGIFDLNRDFKSTNEIDSENQEHAAIFPPHDRIYHVTELATPSNNQSSGITSEDILKEDTDFYNNLQKEKGVVLHPGVTSPVRSMRFSGDRRFIYANVDSRVNMIRISK